MNTATDLILIGALAAAWLTSGLLADALPGARTARELRRRTRLLSTMVGAGIAVLLAVPVLTGLLPGESSAPAAALLPAVPAVVVMLMTSRRLAQLRRGAGVFTDAPHAPAPPALRAAAAHPWVATPLQVTGLAALVGLPIAGGVVEVPGADVAGIAITVVAVLVLALVLRHAVRHSRLNLAVLAPLGRGGLRAPASVRSGAERYTPVPEETSVLTTKPAAAPAGPMDLAA
ncbi:hypothetical protein [Symbioplanes lichenis]|uniref:hypothetical protein n=1 Tax=Symbioplanes lichenis TaxID=1629072 RepID=UPI002738A7B6|nr:hypothetical protein [Actinoplanes lichenis]